ncbi:MAG: redoxin domain-containing protein [Opitutae bacterium]|nr:redoxin domain-containing protein [Opitutae bacterium]
MSLLKSVFISTYMMLASALTAYAGWRFYQENFADRWFGVLLTTVPILFVLGRLMLLRPTARTSARFPMINLAAAIGFGITVKAGLLGAGLALPAMGAAGWAGLLLYIHWYSKLERPESPLLKPGATLPKFVLKDTNLLPVGSAELLGKTAIWLFYRGNWCPLCMAQIKELVEARRDISAVGARVILVSPQPATHTAALADKYDADFDFLVDEGNAVARLLRINDPFGVPMGMQMLGYASETVLPTVIITDPQGKVLWTDQTENYRVRPEPAAYLEVIRQHGLVPQIA